MKQKKWLLPAVIALGVLVVIGGALALMRQGGSQTADTDEATKRRIAEPLNTIEVGLRPFVEIVPEADGRWLRIKILEVKKPATAAEYEIEYQAGTLLQGAGGLIPLTNGVGEHRLQLGSCSAGGACTYHEDVKGGNLRLTFEGPERYALRQDWRYFDNQTRETAFSSKDAKFQIEAAGLATNLYLIVYNTPGYPGELSGTLVTDVYSLTSSANLTGQAEVTLRANEDGATSILVWNGSSWTALDTVVEGKTLTAAGPIGQVYVGVKE